MHSERGGCQTPGLGRLFLYFISFESFFAALGKILSALPWRIAIRSSSLNPGKELKLWAAPAMKVAGKYGTTEVWGGLLSDQQWLEGGGAKEKWGGNKKKSRFWPATVESLTIGAHE